MIYVLAVTSLVLAFLPRAEDPGMMALTAIAVIATANVVSATWVLLSPPAQWLTDRINTWARRQSDDREGRKPDAERA